MLLSSLLRTHFYLGRSSLPHSSARFVSYRSAVPFARATALRFARGTWIQWSGRVLRIPVSVTEHPDTLHSSAGFPAIAHPSTGMIPVSGSLGSRFAYPLSIKTIKKLKGTVPFNTFPHGRLLTEA